MQRETEEKKKESGIMFNYRCNMMGININGMIAAGSVVPVRHLTE